MGVLKVEQIFKGSLYSIPLPSPSLEIQITGGKVCLRCKTKKNIDIALQCFSFTSS